MAQGRAADMHRALRRSLARNLRRCARHVREDRDQPVRPAQQEERPARTALRRRNGHGDPRSRNGAEGLLRGRPDGRWAGLRTRRNATPSGGRKGRFRVVQRRKHCYERLSVSHDRQRQSAARAWQRGADRHVRAAGIAGPFLRHHVLVRAAGGLVAVGYLHPGRL